MKMLLNLKMFAAFITFFIAGMLQPASAAEPITMALVAETTNAVVFVVTAPNNKPTFLDDGTAYSEVLQVNTGGERIGAVNRSAVVVNCGTTSLKSAPISIVEKGETVVSNTPEQVADTLIQRDFVLMKERTAGRMIVNYVCGTAVSEPANHKNNATTFVPL